MQHGSCKYLGLNTCVANYCWAQALAVYTHVQCMLSDLVAYDPLYPAVNIMHHAMVGILWNTTMVCLQEYMDSCMLICLMLCRHCAMSL